METLALCWRILNCRLAYKNPALQEYMYGATGSSEFQYFSEPGNLHLMARILIADDHDGTRGILKVLLQQHSGWEVCGEASTGEEVLKKCIELKPDVIVKDWVMPGMDSIQLTREISTHSPGTAIVIFSFYDMPELVEAAKAAGVHRVATKNIATLIPAIEDVLRSSANRLIGSSESTNQASPEPPKENLD